MLALWPGVPCAITQDANAPAKSTKAAVAQNTGFDIFKPSIANKPFTPQNRPADKNRVCYTPFFQVCAAIRGRTFRSDKQFVPSTEGFSR
jgi:hypothetical protein